MEELWKSFGTLFITVAVSGVWAGKKFMAKWRSKSNAQKKIDEAEAEKQRVLADHTRSNNAQIAVQRIVSRILGATDSDRVGIFQYSNGEKTLTGDCFRYVTCTSEDTAPGISSIMPEFTRKFINPDIAFVVDKIDKSNDFLIIKSKELKGTEKVLQDSYGTACSYNFKLGKSVWEGVLSIVWMNEERMLSEDQLGTVRAYIKLINDLKK